MIAGLVLSLSVATGAAGGDLAPGFLDAGRLWSLCAVAESEAPDSRQICLGYIVGSVDQLLAREARLPARARTICPPPRLVVDDLAAMVIGRGNLPRALEPVGAAGYVEQAMRAAYPCR